MWWTTKCILYSRGWVFRWILSNDWIYNFCSRLHLWCKTSSKLYGKVRFALFRVTEAAINDGKNSILHFIKNTFWLLRIRKVRIRGAKTHHHLFDVDRYKERNFNVFLRRRDQHEFSNRLTFGYQGHCLLSYQWRVIYSIQGRLPRIKWYEILHH